MEGPPQKRQKMASTELVIYMVWRNTWFVRQENGQRLGAMSIRELFTQLNTTAQYMGLRVDLPNKRQFIAIIDRLWTRGTLVVREAKEEIYVSVPETIGQDIEQSLQKAASGEKTGKIKLTNYVRNMHAKFIRLAVWKSLDKAIEQEEIAGLMKHAADVSWE